MEAVDPTKSTPGRRAAILGIVLVGLLLRAVPIPWGTVFVDPDQVGFHPDESKLVRFADGFPETALENSDYRYPLLAHDVLGVLWQGVVRVYPMDPGPPVAGQPRFELATVFGRSLYVLVLGLGGLWMLASFTRILGEAAAVPWVLAAASMQSFTVANTALVQTDLPMAFALLGLMGACLRIERRGAWRPQRDPLVLGALLGVSVALKYTSLVGLLPVATVAALAWGRGWARGRDLLQGALVFWLVAAAVFCAFVPGVLFDFDDFRKSIAYELTNKTHVFEFKPDLYFERLTLTLPIWLALLAAFGYAARRAARRSLVVGSSIVMFAAYLFLVRAAFRPDWALPLMPLVAVLSGLGLAQLATRFGRAGAWVAALIVLGGWVQSGRTVHARYADETRYRFAHWVKQTVEAPGPIGMAPPAARRSWASGRLPEGYSEAGVHGQPKWIVMGEREAKPLRRVHEDPRSFERQGIVFDPEQKVLGRLKPRDIDFYRDLLYPTGDIQWTPPEGYVPGFDYELVESITPGRWALDMAGLEIRIYRRRDAVSER